MTIWLLKTFLWKSKEAKFSVCSARSAKEKTTTIRSIAGILEFDGGMINFDEQDVSLSSCKDRGFHFPDLTNESFWKATFNTEKTSQLAAGEGQVLALEDALKKAGDVLLLDNQFLLYGQANPRK